MANRPKYALLVVDVQDSFKVDAARWAERNNPEFERNVTALIDAFEQHEQAIFYILHQDEDDGFRPSDEAARLSDFLSPREHDLTLTKNTRGSFASTDLDARLKALQIERLVVTGIQTEQCCETTTRQAADLGYKVIFVTEATRTFPIKHWSKPGAQLTTDQITERTEYVLAGRFAQIMDVNAVVAELQANC